MKTVRDAALAVRDVVTAPGLEGGRCCVGARLAHALGVGTHYLVGADAWARMMGATRAHVILLLRAAGAGHRPLGPEQWNASVADVWDRLAQVEALPDLSGADLRWADLHGADLHGADLRGADLRWADLRWADLRWADLRGADLGVDDGDPAELIARHPPLCTVLRGADLRWADLREADLRGADLRVAALSGADLRRADLRGADLRWADLREADLRGADLREADLRGADLRGADLPN